MKKTRKNALNYFPAGVEKFDKNALLKTWTEYIGGNNDVKENLVLQFLSACKDILDFMVYKNTKLVSIYEEAVSIMSLKTCEFVNAALDTDCRNPIASYWQIIKFVVADLIGETMVATPQAIRWRREHNVPTAQREPLNDESLIANDSHVFDVLTDIRELAGTENERKFIDLKLAGYFDTEVIEKLHLKQNDCTSIRKKLRSRYEDHQ